jgi:DnaJ-class molecular chaperone
MKKSKTKVPTKKGNGIKPVVIKSLAPYRCPICGGNGLVSGSFYTALLGCGGTSANITEQCRSCNGAGIIWG